MVVQFLIKLIKTNNIFQDIKDICNVSMSTNFTKTKVISKNEIEIFELQNIFLITKIIKQEKYSCFFNSKSFLFLNLIKI